MTKIYFALTPVHSLSSTSLHNVSYQIVAMQTGVSDEIVGTIKIDSFYGYVVFDRSRMNALSQSPTIADVHQLFASFATVQKIRNFKCDRFDFC